MQFGEAFKFSVESLRANKVRTFLTALGLMIGNASVILVVTISITGRDYILDQIRAIGSNIIYASYSAGTNAQATADADFLKLADLDAVRQQLGSRDHCRHRRNDRFRSNAHRRQRAGREGHRIG